MIARYKTLFLTCERKSSIPFLYMVIPYVLRSNFVSVSWVKGSLTSFKRHQYTETPTFVVCSDTRANTMVGNTVLC